MYFGNMYVVSMKDLSYVLFLKVQTPLSDAAACYIGLLCRRCATPETAFASQKTYHSVYIPGKSLYLNVEHVL